MSFERVTNMNGKECHHCGNRNNNSRYFCTKCGAFLYANNYINKNYPLNQLKLLHIIDDIRHMNLSESVQDELYSYYTNKIKYYEENLNSSNDIYHRKIIDEIKAFLNLCRYSEFQIAFVGTIKTGKSTLINALLGDNYASMAVTPETATLTKFHFSHNDYIQVEFYSHTEWEKLWSSRNNAEKFMDEYTSLNAEQYKNQWIGHEIERKNLSPKDVHAELSKWSSSKSPEHFFVKEIKVGISTLPKDFPPQVVFVDTPGLFDPVEYRSQITKEYIRRANAVFVCIDAQRINQSEKEAIASVFSITQNNKDKVHIIATHWDKLNNPEAGWREQKDYLIGHLTGNQFFPTSKIAKDNIIATAAYIYNLCRDFDKLDKKDLISLRKFALDYDYDINNSKHRKILEEKTNVNTIYHIIREKLIENHKVFLSEDIKHRYTRIINDLYNWSKRESKNDEIFSSPHKLSSKNCKASKFINLKEIDISSHQINKILKTKKQYTEKDMKILCKEISIKIEQYLSKSMEFI